MGGRLAAEVAARLAVLGLVLLTGCEHKAPPPAPPPPKVSVVTVQAQAVPITTELPGRVAGYRYADVRPQVNGIILKRLFVEGSDVKAGQQLYQIDPAPYQATYDSAVAADASARALAERYKPLAEANAVSKQDYDNAVASHLQARAAVETARINLIYTRVLSPITGRIGRSLMTLLRWKREAAAGLVKQNEAGKAQVRVRLEDGSDYAHSGTLEFSEVTVDEGTGSVTLRALMPNPERLLLPGMFVREEIQEGVRQGAVLAPQQGISHDQKGAPNALVVGPDDTVELRTLETDRAIGDQWLVTAGLKPGDRIIVEGIQSARPGGKVAPEEYRPAGERTAQPRPATAQDSAN